MERNRRECVKGAGEVWNRARENVLKGQKTMERNRKCVKGVEEYGKGIGKNMYAKEVVEYGNGQERMC